MPVRVPKESESPHPVLPQELHGTDFPHERDEGYAGTDTASISHPMTKSSQEARADPLCERPGVAVGGRGWKAGCGRGQKDGCGCGRTAGGGRGRKAGGGRGRNCLVQVHKDPALGLGSPHPSTSGSLNKQTLTESQQRLQRKADPVGVPSGA